MSRGTRAQVAIAIVLGVYVGVTLLAPLFAVLLMLFAGLLVAAFLHGSAHWIHAKTRIPQKLALLIVCVLIVASVVAWAMLAAPSIAKQFGELGETLPVALDRLAARVGQEGWGQYLIGMFEGGDVMTSGRLVAGARTAFSLISELLGAGLLILFVGLFVAADPGVYRRGSLALVPVRRRDRLGEVLEDLASTLRHWLLAQLFSMAVVGVMTWVGLTLLDVPLALTLALVAALLTFIPNLGPILAAVPAILLGLMVSPTTAVGVGVLYIGIQIAETYGITPFVQRRMLDLPAALIIAAQAIFGVIGGIFGLLVATPLAAAIVVVVRELYVEDVVDAPVSKQAAAESE